MAPLRPRRTKQNRFPEILNDQGEPMKHCKKCDRILLASSKNFHNDEGGMYGLNYMCRDCVSNQGRRWREKNKERKAIADKEYASANKDKIRSYQKEYRDKNKEKAREYNEKYRSENSDSLRIRARDSQRKRRASDPMVRVRESVSSNIRGGIKRGKGSIRHLPYTVEELMTHLEKQFSNGMNWGNYGEWHIDHILPITSFDIKELGDSEFIACWSLSNLRPLWVIDNIIKSNNRTHLI